MVDSEENYKFDLGVKRVKVNNGQENINKENSN